MFIIFRKQLRDLFSVTRTINIYWYLIVPIFHLHLTSDQMYMTFLFVFCHCVYVCVCYVMWFACIIFIDHIYSIQSCAICTLLITMSVNVHALFDNVHIALNCTVQFLYSPRNSYFIYIGYWTLNIYYYMWNYIIEYGIHRSPKFNTSVICCVVNNVGPTVHGPPKCIQRCRDLPKKTICVIIFGHIVHIPTWDPYFICAPTQGQIVGSSTQPSVSSPRL